MTRQEKNDYIVGLHNNSDFMEKNNFLILLVDELYSKDKTVEELANLDISFQDKLTDLSDENIKNVYIRFNLKKLFWDKVGR